MNKIKEACQVYQFDFHKKPNSLSELLFAPQFLTMRDGTVTERMQSWLIDHRSFIRASKYLYQRVLDSSELKPIFTREEIIGLYAILDNALLIESIAGRFFFISMTSMILRSIELFSQSARNALNLSALHANTKRILDYSIMPAAFLFSFWLGYDSKDLIYYIVIPAFLEKVLSFTWANYFRQIHTLSSTKDFKLNDFISKNIKALFIRMLPLLLLFLYKPLQNYSPAWMSFCKSSEHVYIKNFNRASETIDTLLLEPIMLTFGKMFFDLAYIFILKTFCKDADLRDPMGWMFSRSRSQVSSSIDIQEEATLEIQGNLNRKRTPKQEAIKTKISAEADNELWNRDTPPTGGGKKRGPKGKEPENEIPSDKKKDSNPPKLNKLVTCANVKVGNRNLAFKRIESSTFNKEIFGLILADPRKTQNIDKYKESLSSGKIGGNIRQLKGAGDRYEIGAKNTDFRLIGKMYNDGIYHSLQGFMSLEDALHASQELERRGIPDNTGLIIFSVETNHKNITQVANKL